MRYIIKKAYNILVQEGDTSGITFVVPDEISLVSRNVEFIVQLKQCDGPDPILSYETGNGISVTDQEITLTIPPEDTEEKSGRYVWYMRLVGSPTDIITIGKGDFNIIDKLER